MTDNSPAIKRVVCPQCGGPSLYAPHNEYRPFCSARCKNIDFGAWSGEDFRLPAEAPLDEANFGEPKLP